MKFRKAIKRDISQMFNIIKMNNKTYPKRLALKELNEMFSKSLLKPTYIVAEDKGKIVAFNGYIHSWVDNLFVNFFWWKIHKDYMNKGIASKLVKDLIKRIRNSKEKPKAKIITISTRLPLFFRKLGFKTIKKNYDRDYDLMAMDV